MNRKQILVGLYEDIQEIKNKAQRYLLEVDKYYNATGLEILGMSQGLNLL